MQKRIKNNSKKINKKLKKVLTKRNKNAIIKKYQTDSKDKTKNRRISNEITNKKEEKTEITSFLFCSKKSKKFFKKMSKKC